MNLSKQRKVSIRDYNQPKAPRVFDIIVEDGRWIDISVQHVKGKHEISIIEIKRQIEVALKSA